MIMDNDVWCRKRMKLQFVFILSVLCIGQLAVNGCSPPEPVDDLVQFIDTMDVTTRTDATYPIGAKVTAQCRELGVKQLRGNTAGQSCQPNGSWSGQPPSCSNFEGKIIVVGGVSQQVTHDGQLVVSTSAVNSTVEVRCSIEGRSPSQTGTPQLEAPHIYVR